jgi:hypothetical protein
VTCSSRTNSQCPYCTKGFFLNTTGKAHKCEGMNCPFASTQMRLACIPIGGCNSTVVCSTATNSQCGLCAQGHFWVGRKDNNTADACQRTLLMGLGSNFFLACSPISGCAGTTTCSAIYASKCSKCADGFFLGDNGTMSNCTGTF